MKPSRPGFLFVGKFLTTESISSPVIHIFRFSISSYLILEDFKSLEIYLFLLTSKVSAEKSAHYLLEFPLCVTICFSLAAFKIPFLSLTFDSLIIMCLDVVLFGSSYLELSGILKPECLFPSLG